MKTVEKRVKSFWQDFKKFLSRGNILDMAVGVIIGASFGKIVTGLVNFVLNPLISLFIRDGSLDSWKSVLRPEVLAADGETVEIAEIAILWGNWIQTIIDFVITAFCIFLILRYITMARTRMEKAKTDLEARLRAEEIAAAEAKAAAEKAAAEAKAAEEKAAAEAREAAEAERQATFEASVRRQETLLEEIRDLLAAKKK